MIWRVAILAIFLTLQSFDCAFALDPRRAIHQFHHTAWSTEEGAPADIWAIAQTPDGFLWLGANNGLYRFDGVRFERVAEHLLPSPSIRALAATPSGGLWIGYERPIGVTSLLENGVVSNFPVDAPSSTSIHNIQLARDGAAWAATPDFVLRFDGRRWRAIESDWGTSLGEANGGVWAFGIARDGVVWSRNRNGLFFLRQGERRFSRAEGYVGGVASFTLAADGRLWTTDSHSGHLYALPDLNDVSGRAPPQPLNGLRITDTVQRGTILLDRDQTLWFTSASGGGLSRVRAGDGSRQDQFGRRDGLSSNVVHTLFEDREGNIWVGTNLGLDRFRVANVTTETRLPAGFRARFVELHNGAIFAYTGWSNTATRAVDGTESLYRILPNQEPQLLVRNVGRLRRMVENRETGDLWLLTRYGLQRLSGSRLEQPITLPQGVPSEALYSAAVDGDGAFWISAFRHGVFRQVRDGWRRVELPQSGSTAVLTADESGRMWIRFAGGALFRAAGDVVVDFSSSVPPIADLTFMRSDERGLWAGGEAGLARFDGERFYALTMAQVPELSVVTGLARSPQGSTWVFTQGAILRFDTETLEAALSREGAEPPPYDVIGPRDGLPGAPYGGVYGSTVATAADGRVWFTTGQGLVWIDPNNVQRNTLAPPVVIRSLSVNGVIYDNPRELRLAPGSANLQIDYTALSLVIPERNRFRYRLEGVDEAWVDAGDRRQAFYTQLGPGTYRFRVAASNNDGVWNEEGAALTFIIPPTFFQSIWFAALCVIASLVGLWLLYSMRLRQVSGRMRERLEERVAERERIARELHDTLLQGFHGLMLKFQLVADQIPPSQPARKLMDAALERADEVLVEGRDRVRNLRPPPPDVDLVRSIIVAVGAEIQEPNAAIIAATHGKARALHPIVFSELSSIGREAMLNALRHADADTIEIIVTYGRRELSLVIRDDGVGIDRAIYEAGGREGHYGLTGMRERAEKIRGEFTLTSIAGEGANVRVVVPGYVAYSTSQRLLGALQDPSDD
ncbi:MAG: hypothetical protein DCF16_07420 [Alphaproteobacteria bacterium]|nr:MAG: hypothetical protein DCF16_07420 [Alphaproteobacteria bacterium]